MNRFKNILLVFDPEGNDETTVSLAASLAERNHADLTLLSVVEDLPPEVRMWVTALPAGELFERVMKDRREQLQSLIESIGAGASGPRCGWYRVRPFWRSSARCCVIGTTW